MRFTVDQQLPPVLAEALRDRGSDAVHVQERALLGAPDRVIWSEAQAQSAIVISRDADFVGLHDVLGGARLVWIRFGNCTNPELLERISEAWSRVLGRLSEGDTLIELR